ncbi:MAG: DUF805 domain-containing protein [Desulfobacterales bacterium]|nr:DUF805 domain-containing protein [Desulfobacterales bacterium]MCP4162998.1 DUF805 domain-containing protein [Deltaproteobacteria bacterium]
MIDNYINVLKNYAIFNGIASREEFWKFTLLNFIIGCIFTITSILDGYDANSNNLLIVPIMYILAIIIPTIAVTVRRLHDTNRSGWWFLFFLIPLIGPIFFIVYLTKDSVLDENRYYQNTDTLHDEIVGMCSVLFVSMMIVFTIFHKEIIDLILC